MGTPPKVTAETNTNFCGTSWVDHYKDCANSTPCPRGDECAGGEACYAGSPCAQTASQDRGDRGGYAEQIMNASIPTKKPSSPPSSNPTSRPTPLPIDENSSSINAASPTPPVSAAPKWENDPDQLCSNNDGATKYTGHKTTRDCRGYVFCNDGFLMGGGAALESPSGVSGGSGVIACRPNQLYDAASGTCGSWQSVDTSNCPDFDGSMMMPDLEDGNANPGKFHCGVSAYQARHVCEACPGGSRLECSNPTHNCFAQIDVECPEGAADGGSSRGSAPSSTTTRTVDRAREANKWYTYAPPLLSPAATTVMSLLWSMCLPAVAGLVNFV